MGIEFYIAGLAALLMALNQGIKDAPQLRAAVPALNFPGWASYIPFVLFFTAFMFHLFPVGQFPNVQTSPIKVTGIPIEAIAKAVDGATSAQKDRQLEPFGTLTADAEGLVDDVSAGDGSFAIVYLSGQLDGRRVTLIFDRDLKAVESFNAGQPVKARCGFSTVTNWSLVLNRCSLVVQPASN